MSVFHIINTTPAIIPIVVEFVGVGRITVNLFSFWSWGGFPLLQKLPCWLKLQFPPLELKFLLFFLLLKVWVGFWFCWKGAWKSAKEDCLFWLFCWFSWCCSCWCWLKPGGGFVWWLVLDAAIWFTCIARAWSCSLRVDKPCWLTITISCSASLFALKTLYKRCSMLLFPTSLVSLALPPKPTFLQSWRTCCTCWRHLSSTWWIPSICLFLPLLLPSNLGTGWAWYLSQGSYFCLLLFGLLLRWVFLPICQNLLLFRSIEHCLNGSYSIPWGLEVFAVLFEDWRDDSSIILYKNQHYV